MQGRELHTSKNQVASSLEGERHPAAGLTMPPSAFVRRLERICANQTLDDASKPGDQTVIAFVPKAILVNADGAMKKPYSCETRDLASSQ